MRAKVLFEQVAKLSEYKRTADILIVSRDSTIKSKNQIEIELKQAIGFCEQKGNEKQIQIESLKRTVKNTRKKWIKTTLYSSGGAAVIGLILGIVIAK